MNNFNSDEKKASETVDNVVAGNKDDTDEWNDSDEAKESFRTELPSSRLILAGLCAVLGSGFHFGFQISLINPLSKILQQFMIESLERRYSIKISEIIGRLLFSSVAGILFIGAVIGATIVPSVMSRLGSRWSFVCITLTMTVGIFLASFSKHLDSAEMFIVARFIVGLCVGMATTVQGVFLTEISPLKCRGLMGTMSGLATNIGFTIASALGLPMLFGSTDYWPLAFYMELIPCIIHLIMIIFVVVESPVYFLRRNQETNARNSASLYYRNKASIEAELERIKTELICGVETSDWSTLYKNVPVRNALILSMLLNLAVSFSGVMATSFFGVFLLAGIGFSTSGAAIANCFSSLSGTVGCLLSSYSIEKIGRRPLIIGSLVSLIIVNSGMMLVVWTFINYNTVWLGYVFLLLFNLFLIVFSVGIGPLAWFISTELTGPVCRVRVQSSSISTQYISSFICPIIYFPLQQLIGPFSFLLFIVPLTFTALYMYWRLPETKNRSVQSIREILAKNNK
uniref:MFS domain-containing protein n=1 Tax=Syphacia muris TaxID=451379 RepID=A0A0N5A8V5_9BILA